MELYTEFYLWYGILFATYFILLFGYLQLSDREDYINNFLAFSAMFFVFTHVLIFLFLMFQVQYLEEAGTIQFFLLVLGLPCLVIGGLTLLSSLIVLIYRKIFKGKDRKEVEIRIGAKMNEMDALRRDIYKKISHVMIFIVLLIIWFIGFIQVQQSEYGHKVWSGMIPEENDMLGLYLQLLSVPSSIQEVLLGLGWFYYLIFFFFYFFCLFLLANELCRKNRFIAFPLTLLPQLVMSEQEKKSYGTYVYFLIGQMFASFVCPPMVYIAILGMSGLSDLMTSQVGIRVGKHHLRWNSKKTWEGTIAGVLTSFMICFIFLGITWALIFSFTFMCIDLFTNKPINASDNLLIPILSAMVYVLVRHLFDLNFIHPFMNMIL